MFSSLALLGYQWIWFLNPPLGFLKHAFRACDYSHVWPQHQIQLHHQLAKFQAPPLLISLQSEHPYLHHLLLLLLTPHHLFHQTLQLTQPISPYPWLPGFAPPAPSPWESSAPSGHGTGQPKGRKRRAKHSRKSAKSHHSSRDELLIDLN